MLEKQILIDKIEVLETDHIQVRQVTRIVEDGNPLSESYTRWVLQKGDDISGQDAKVQAVCNTVWAK
jgi:hypothetical protein